MRCVRHHDAFSGAGSDRPPLSGHHPAWKDANSIELLAARHPCARRGFAIVTSAWCHAQKPKLLPLSTAMSGNLAARSALREVSSVKERRTRRRFDGRANNPVHRALFVK